jgi:exopolyphosphatase/pppGpp-phosphohydrolase
MLGPLRPPRPQLALASGGSARALARLVGTRLGPDEVDRAIDAFRRRRSAKVARAAGIDERRAPTVLAGALILREAQRALDRPLRLARGGLREGAALSLAREAPAAAA